MSRALMPALVLALSCSVAFGCGKKDDEEETPTDTDTDTETETDTPSDTETDTPSDTETDTPSDTETEPVCPGGCLIDAVCHADGDVSGDNPCLRCDAATSATSWSDNDGATCDDGAFCNGVDTCEAGACTAHAGDPCGDNGLYCDGSDSCDDDADACAHSGDPCADWGEACFEENDSCTACRVLVNGDLADYADHDGSSWELAFATVQEGLDAAAALVETSFFRCQVWVAAGTYVPTTDEAGEADPLDPRTRTLHVPEGVGLYGGFAGTEEHLAQRDVAANETILSGDLTAPVDPVDDPSDNAYHVVVTSSGNVVDGLTLRGGNADVSDWPHFVGAGLLAIGGSATIVGCTFDGNTADAFMGEGSEGQGGGVYATGGTLELSGCAFTSNGAYDSGGGLYAYDEEVSLSDTVFDGNAAEYGGAAYVDDCAGAISGCAFDGNGAFYGGALYLYENAAPSTGGLSVADCSFSGNTAEYGAGAYLYDNEVEMTGCSFDANSATYGGGSSREYDASSIGSSQFTNNSATWGGGIYTFNCGWDPASGAGGLTGSTFTGNEAAAGGAIYSEGSGYRIAGSTFAENLGEDGAGLYIVDNVEIEECEITANEATGDGGGVFFGGAGAPAIARCTISSNAATSGGGVRLAGEVFPSIVSDVFFQNTATGSGGGIYSDAYYDEGEWPWVDGCTFVDNDAAISGDGFWGGPYTLGFRSSIFRGSTDQIVSVYSVTVYYSDVEGGWSGPGNVDVDPLFVSATDFHLQATSPLIDAGEGCSAPALDRDGNSRRDIAAIDNTGAGPAVDIGAFEAQGGDGDGPANGWVLGCCDLFAPAGDGEPGYAFCDFPRTFEAARSLCEADGIALAAITTPGENALVHGYIGGSSTGVVFIGGTDAASEGAWEWLTGEPWSWTNWAVGEPNDYWGYENCAEMYPASGQWNDGSCAGAYAFVCEGDVGLDPIGK